MRNHRALSLQGEGPTPHQGGEEIKNSRTRARRGGGLDTPYERSASSVHLVSRAQPRLLRKWGVALRVQLALTSMRGEMPK